jgi:hypothetical protein
MTTTYHVIAYDESWGGYGDNRSKDFDNEADAVAYARQVRDGQYPSGPRFDPKIVKKTTTEPVVEEIEF